MRTEVEIQRQHDAAAHETGMRPAVAARAGAGVRGCLVRRRAWKFGSKRLRFHEMCGL